MLYNRLYDVYYIEALGGRGKIHPRRPIVYPGRLYTVCWRNNNLVVSKDKSMREQ